jgi:ribonuclease Z
MTVHFLGTGSALTSAQRTTTMLAFEADQTYFLVDCGGDAVQRLLTAGLDPTRIEAVVLTHEHPDHVGGFALLVEKLWLHGRRAPIPVYGLEPTLSVARRLFEVFDTTGWRDMPPLEWWPVANVAGAAVFERGPFRVVASPVVHPVPTVGLRVEAGGASVAYSCDTEPCESVVALAHGVDLLVHEATGHLPGVHSSAAEAAGVAKAAGAKRLVLVHLPPEVYADDLLDAQSRFGPTAWAEEGGRVVVSA